MILSHRRNQKEEEVDQDQQEAAEEALRASAVARGRLPPVARRPRAARRGDAAPGAASRGASPRGAVATGSGATAHAAAGSAAAHGRLATDGNARGDEGELRRGGPPSPRGVSTAAPVPGWRSLRSKPVPAAV